MQEVFERTNYEVLKRDNPILKRENEDLRKELEVALKEIEVLKMQKYTYSEMQFRDAIVMKRKLSLH